MENLGYILIGAVGVGIYNKIRYRNNLRGYKDAEIWDFDDIEIEDAKVLTNDMIAEYTNISLSENNNYDNNSNNCKNDNK